MLKIKVILSDEMKQKLYMLYMIFFSLLSIFVLLKLKYNYHRVLPGDILHAQGYNVENIEFEEYNEAEWWEGRIYQSSMPIHLKDGSLCDLWQIKYYGRSARFQNVVLYGNED